MLSCQTSVSSPKGGTPDIIHFIADRYEQGFDPTETLELVKEKPEATKSDLAFAEFCRHTVFTNPQILIENMDYIVHFHGKFYDVTEDLEETSIPYYDVLTMLKENGYDGYISSEYEGNRHIQDYVEVNSIEQVSRHQQMLKKLIG
ncbi:hypothetical protein BN1356_00516 [Streptococcus varani]|uniref:Xylose isomerase-like TIM barrel domain-containing protein n=1 Tax=Streptococcus varani TaxID=1608583 RepID=A0A0E4CS58_9STRE|nr:hypothetical protein [Streptococcus varani]CQR24155.1 hypothetical protein BN1356_00516 [Streptococcus varani]